MSKLPLLGILLPGQMCLHKTNVSKCSSCRYTLKMFGFALRSKFPPQLWRYTLEVPGNDFKTELIPMLSTEKSPIRNHSRNFMYICLLIVTLKYTRIQR